MSKNKVVTIPKTTAKMKAQAPRESKRAQDNRAAKAAAENAKSEEAKAERIGEEILKQKVKEAKAQDPKWHSIIIPALDALIGDPEILMPEKDTKLKAEIMYIPDQYIDRVCDWRDELTTRGEAAKNLLRIFSNILEEIHDAPGESRLYTCKNGMKICFVNDIQIPHGANNKSATVNALAVANHYNQLQNSDVAILTGDDYMASKALKNGIDVARINPDVYTGRRKLQFPLNNSKALEQWLHQGFLTEKMFRELFPDEAPLRINEFVEFENLKDETDENGKPIANREVSSRLTNGIDRGPWNYIGRWYCVMGEDGKPEKYPCLQSLTYIRELPIYLKPRNSGQAMFAEALLAPPEEIPIVICPSTFGTGKTYLAIGIGLYLVEKGDYMRVFVVPRDSELGKEIGFLPGTEFEKTIAKAMPIVDNIEAYLKNKWIAKGGNGSPKIKKGKKEGAEAKSKGSRKGNSQAKHDWDAQNAEAVEAVAAAAENAQSKKAENVFAIPEGIRVGLTQLKEWAQKIIKKLVEFVSVINMGGRSISCSWMIYDEAQDLERFQMNQLMKRIGDNSKMVITGDPRQVYNHHMNERSNGLSYAATKMAGSPYAAVITMNEDEITRSVAAQVISQRLDH